MKNILVLCLALSLTSALSAQKYFTKTGQVNFTSEAPLEKIEAKNSKATSVLDTEAGRLEFAVLIKAFQFEKALMQEHFNENYLESDKYPKSTFKGTIENNADVAYKKDGTYPAIIKGDLSLHGVTKPVMTKAIIRVKDGQISAEANFSVLVADYNIEIPALVKDKIAKTVVISVKVDYEALKKQG